MKSHVLGRARLWGSVGAVIPMKSGDTFRRGVEIHSGPLGRRHRNQTARPKETSTWDSSSHSGTQIAFSSKRKQFSTYQKADIALGEGHGNGPAWDSPIQREASCCLSVGTRQAVHGVTGCIITLQQLISLVGCRHVTLLIYILVCGSRRRIF